MSIIAEIAGPKTFAWSRRVVIKDSGILGHALEIEQANPTHKRDSIWLTVDQAEALFVTLDLWLVSKGR